MLAWLWVASTVAASAEFTPYDPDEWTLHLWHLDEGGAPFQDTGSKGRPLLGLLNEAEAGKEAAAGLGRSVSMAGIASGERGTPELRGGILLAATQLHEGEVDDVRSDFGIAGEDGAFTYEAVVRFDVLPAESPQWAMSVISMDNDGDLPRLFNFRVEASNLLAFIPLQEGVEGAALGAIPTEGPHGINTEDWFHVAVTYDGREGAFENLNLYWTRLGPGLQAAHRIGSGTLSADLVPVPADFALGNEARTIWGNGESEPLVGRIDEVRISSVARDPTDFFFVDPERRRGPSEVGPAAPAGPPSIRLAGVQVDGRPLGGFGPERPAVLPPGQHRVDFDFRLVDPPPGSRAQLRYRLKGVDDRWLSGQRGMLISWEVLDAEGRDLSLHQAPVLGSSVGWSVGWENSEFTRRYEPIHLPPGARFLRLSVSSGVLDTTGSLAIDNISFSTGSELLDWWENPGFEEGEEIGLPGGTPRFWERDGSAPAIARMIPRGDGAALALIDGDQAASARWTCMQALPPIPAEGMTMVAKWDECYRVFAGVSNRATFLNVPPGQYEFQVAAVGGEEDVEAAYLSQRITVRAPIYANPVFWAVLAALVVGSIVLGVFADLRRRQTRKLADLRVRTALAEDRARIARDMHDDLGTRLTRLSMNVAMAERDLVRDAGAVPSRLERLGALSRDLVTSMDALVWVVDPANDKLDQFAARLAGLGEEVLEGSAIRLVLDFPEIIPDWTVRSAPRHHLFLGVKEALHNVLKHAGPCTALLSFRLRDQILRIAIEDDGCGFETGAEDEGNGLKNLVARLEQLGGSCSITSEPGAGTKVVFECPLEALQRSSGERK